MDQDHLSYKRAAGVSLIGLAIQFSVGLVLLLYGLFGGDPYTLPASFAVLLAVPIWVLLALVFHQHKRERLEAHEAEAFAEAEGAAASVFEEAGADQVVEARRLAWMHRYLLPGASVVIGVSFVAVGGWVYSRSGTTAENFTGDGPAFGGVGLAIGVISALVSFIFARYAAGMAKERVWLLLNGGAGAAVQIALLGGLVGLAHFLAAADLSTALLQWLPAVVGVLMIAQGGEIFLNFLLNLYRPRSTGDYLRPAFDSRVLAYVAAPDRLAQSISEAINYQFGFSVSSTWFYRLLSRWVLVLVLLLVVVAWLMTSLVVIKPNERGILLRNGVAGDDVMTPGLVVKAPWPWARVVSFSATALNEIGFGTAIEVDEAQGRRAGDFLWTNADIRDETMFIVNPVPARAADDLESAQGLSVLVGRVVVQYTIEDVRSYYEIAQDGSGRDAESQRRRFLEVQGGSVVTRELGERRVDELLRGDWGALDESFREALQERFDAAGAGVRVRSVGVEGLSPASGAAEAFERLTAARLERASAVQGERSASEGLLAEAAGDASTAQLVVEELEELRELESRERRLRRSGEAERAASLRDEIERRRDGVSRSLLESGGLAAQILSRARADRWEASLGARAEALRSLGRQALFEASPTAYVVKESLAAVKAMVDGQRVYVGPPGIGLRLNLEEVSSRIDIGVQSGGGEGSEN